ncbi:hypothetical protein HHK36_012160 [Tetracentron sinense]|uniref:WD repeat-containing protein 6 n=1 Tax=Tetracentron sinense TaxID=13715 RepID=A0A834Z8L3_TETSI|nr:hypothetical protein HHK36_012160 [Tetracentron sinense]
MALTSSGGSFPLEVFILMEDMKPSLHGFEKVSFSFAPCLLNGLAHWLASYSLSQSRSRIEVVSLDLQDSLAPSQRCSTPFGLYPIEFTAAPVADPAGDRSYSLRVFVVLLRLVPTNSNFKITFFFFFENFLPLYICNRFAISHGLHLFQTGTGSQVLLYDVEAGKQLKSFPVFEGIRVHGIFCTFLDCTEGVSSSTLAFKIAVLGERRVKIFSLHFEMGLECQNEWKVSAELILIHLLPKFSQWVLDACFLKDVSFEHERNSHLAIGLSDNSVCLWDASKSTIVLEVRCPEKCLLYSMRLWGDNLKALRIASGTIYNEIIVWKVVPQSHTQSLTNSVDSSNLSSSFCNNLQLHDQQYDAICLSRLTGHEGSIFRIAWSSDGSKLMSVSDDRSARIWTIRAEKEDSADPREAVGLVLFGHNARVWDCCIADSLMVTCGEDCTCRVWGMDGNQLKVIKEHTGRGIWRCLYDPRSSLLITAGFDSAMKVHQLHASLSGGSMVQCEEEKDFKDETEIFTICTPNLSLQLGLMDSKSEYVRYLCFTREDTLYVATNHGYLHHVKLSGPGDVKWTELVRVSEEVPIVCMDLLSTSPSEFSRDVEDWIAVGDGKGNMTVVRIDGVCTPTVALAFTWSAGVERQLLGTYWCKSLGCSFIFTADPRGMLKFWRISDPLQSVSHKSIINHDASLIAEFESCFGTRIMCLDASFDEEVLVCGDQRGNLIVFPLSKDVLLGTSVASEAKIPPLNYFKGAHGISSVSSISTAKFSFNQVEIRSTGGDGCICYFKYDGDWRSLEFMGMKQVRELSLIQFVSADANSAKDLACGNYAIGFTSADFIIWNLINETKVIQVPCGGWRRPHSCYLGDVPEIQNCFAFVKDNTIHIHRHWTPVGERKLFPRVLHMQFHGREVHSLRFVSEGSQFNAHKSASVFTRLSWIATGCEDGTVRLTRYAPDTENWFASKLLGEHVGGSAVRSICFVSKVHITSVDRTYESNCRSSCTAASENINNQLLLISVGAKRVLTSWLLRNSRVDNKEEALDDGPLNKTGNNLSPLSRELSSMSFQWLSTDMPAKFSSTHRTENTEEIIGQVENASSMKAEATSIHFAKNGEMESKSGLRDKYENDWRYLAVTAFLVKVADCRLTVCFVIVACSDATLTLRGLLLPYRLWFDIASLVPLSSPVLALQHVIIPVCSPSKGNIQIGSVYIVISGSTDGSIAFWDLTESVEGFMQRVSSLQPETFIDCQKRPRTGRGSQGGRWWRSLSNRSSTTNPKGTIATINAKEGINGHMTNHLPCGTSSKLRIDPGNSATACSFHESDTLTDDSSSEMCEIRPLHVLNYVHQSGVNCLHISNSNECPNSELGSIYCVLSGGDDQALHSLVFDLELQPTNQNSENKKSPDINHITELGNVRIFSPCSEKKDYRIRFISHDRIASAHSSAVKGVWTDGIWAFSTGLDQRVRCWHFEEDGKLTEHAHLIISVPEPETLDARVCGRNQYQIAVAGRGMQMVEFSASCDIESRD